MTEVETLGCSIIGSLVKIVFIILFIFKPNLEFPLKLFHWLMLKHAVITRLLHKMSLLQWMHKLFHNIPYSSTIESKALQLPLCSP